MHDPIPSEFASIAAPGLDACLRRLRDVVWRRWRLVTAVIVASVLLAGVYLVRTERLYEATGRLLLLQQGVRPLSAGKDDGVRNVEHSDDFIPTQMAVLQSPRIVERAIATVGAENLPTLHGSRGAPSLEEMTRTAIKYYLKVLRPDRTASILLIRYRAASTGEATRMVAALVASYHEFLISNDKNDASKLVSIISRARDELGHELQGLEQKYLEFQKTNPLLLEDGSKGTLINSRLVELDRAANEATVKAMRLRSQLAIGRKLAAEGAEMWAVAYAIAQVGADQGIALIPRSAETTQGISADYLRQLIKEQQELAATYGPGYSKVKELQEQIASVGQRTREAIGTMDRGDIGQLLSSIERSLETVESLRAQVGDELAQDVEKAKKNAIEMTVGRNLQNQLDRQKSLFFAVIEELKQAQFGGDFGTIAAQPIERANALDRPVHPQSLLILLGSLAIGGILGIGLALLADELDSRIHSLEDLRRAFDYPVLGLIARIAPDQLGRSAEGRLLSHVLPRAPATEAHKVLRTNVEFLRRRRHIQVILVTSSVAREGKTTTASNLAISLAHAGRKVLLIDADLRRPALGAVYRLASEPGLAQFLQEPIGLDDVVRSTHISGLDVLTTGGVAANPAELLMSGRMQELLDECRRSYDFVIIDSSPLLAVTDPALIGAWADGALLVLRASMLKRQLLSRAVELLKSSGTPVLGAVITGIEDQAFEKQYGYESYGSTTESAELAVHRSPRPGRFAPAGAGLFARDVSEPPPPFSLSNGTDHEASSKGSTQHQESAPFDAGSQDVLALAFGELVESPDRPG
jgi:capsular exopolysaccharide synthesis family protein